MGPRDLAMGKHLVNTGDFTRFMASPQFTACHGESQLAPQHSVEATIDQLLRSVVEFQVLFDRLVLFVLHQ
jgi:hypothetical protein